MILQLLGQWDLIDKELQVRWKALKAEKKNSYQPFWDKQIGKVSLHSYFVETKSKSEGKILVLSIFDPILGTTEDKMSKPAIIKFYDYTKGGTDIVDQRIGNYTTKPKVKKWILVVFFYILDTTCINAQTIYCQNNDIYPRDYKSYEFGMAHSYQKNASLLVTTR